MPMNQHAWPSAAPVAAASAAHRAARCSRAAGQRLRPARAGRAAGRRGPSRAAIAATLPQPHFAPKAKNVIFCFMDGGVSHVDSFDPKPKLDELDGKAVHRIEEPDRQRQPPVAEEPVDVPAARPVRACRSASCFRTSPACADDLAVIRSMKADLPLHSTGVLFLHTGVNNAGRPSLGSWVNYGLGSENQNLPGFVVLSFGVVPCGGLENFSSGFLPASHQATLFARRRHADRQHRARPTRTPASSRPSSPCSREQDDGVLRSRWAADDAVESAIRNYETGLPHAVAGARRARPGPRNGGDAEAVRHRFARSRRSGCTASSACGPGG